MAFSFNRYVPKSDAFIHEVATELGHPEDTDRAYRIFRSVLHALRDNIPVEENLHLMAQLPMLVKALYVDNWKIHGDGGNVRHLDQFLAKVQEMNTFSEQKDLHTPEQTQQAVLAVFHVLKRHVSSGEIGDIMSMLPKEIRAVLQE